MTINTSNNTRTGTTDQKCSCKWAKTREEWHEYRAKTENINHEQKTLNQQGQRETRTFTQESRRTQVRTIKGTADKETQLTEIKANDT